MSGYRSWSGAFTVRPANEHIGADVEGIELARAAGDRQVMHEIREALSRHLVLRIRRQALTPDEAVRFTEYFGPLMDVRRPSPPAVHVPGYPGIQVLSNGLDAQGRRLGDGNTSAQIWHSDSGQWEVPPGVVLFYCRTTADPAPATKFLNMIAVYAALPEHLKARIANLRARHHMYSQSVDVDVHRNGRSLPREQRAAGMPHPLVRRHLWTGQPILFLPTRRDSIIDGLADDEARALLTELWDFADAAPCQWSTALVPDDVVIWDNAASVHCREGWPAQQTRAMWHLLSEGEQPTPMFARRTVNANDTAQPGY
ncbi:MAG: TauD/TfdA dioxygenase family protein [Gammaproteobacteria bacterium]